MDVDTRVEEAKTKVEEAYNEAKAVRVLYTQLPMTNLVKWAVEKLSSFESYKVKGGADTKVKAVSLLYNVYAEAIEIYDKVSALKYMMDYNDTLAIKVGYIEIFNIVKRVSKRVGIAYTAELYIAELQEIKNRAVDSEGVKKASPANVDGKAVDAVTRVAYEAYEALQAENAELKEKIAGYEVQLEDLNKKIYKRENAIVTFSRQCDALQTDNESLRKKLAKYEGKAEQTVDTNKPAVKEPDNTIKPAVEEPKVKETVSGAAYVPNVVKKGTHIWELYGLTKHMYYKRKAEGTLPELSYAGAGSVGTAGAKVEKGSDTGTQVEAVKKAEGAVKETKPVEKPANVNIKKLTDDSAMKKPNKAVTAVDKAVSEDIKRRATIHIWDRYGLSKRSYYKHKAEGTLPLELPESEIKSSEIKADGQLVQHVWDKYGLTKHMYYKLKAEGNLPNIKND